MNAAERYRQMVLDRQEQQSRLSLPFDASYWDCYAHTYRFNPRRLPEPSIREVIRRMEMEDEVIEVGGGAGRVGLTLALRAKSLRNVEPSAEMRKQFQQLVHEHEIHNATVVESAWPTAEPMSADVVVTADVTYFITEIVPFIGAMHEAARRRVAILTWTVPPPNVDQRLFELGFGEQQSLSPGYQELLRVIWELGVVPDVLVLDDPYHWPERLPTNDEDALRFACEQLGARDAGTVAARLRPHIGALFNRDLGYLPTWRPPSKAMLITWSTSDWQASWRPR